MNHVTTPTPESLRASDWFASYLREKCIDKNATTRLADAIGMERKQIYKYASGGCSRSSTPWRRSSHITETSRRRRRPSEAQD